MASPAKVQAATITARIDLKHNAEKYKTLAHQIRALEVIRFKKHQQGNVPFGPVAVHSEDIKKALFSNKPFSNDITTIDVTDAVVTYTTEVGVGANVEKFTLLIDTGSSNTFVGANNEYVPTKTSTDTGDTVKVTYGSGSFTGKQYIDRVSLSPDLIIEEQGISVTKKNQAQGFDDVDGILGIGPVALTVGTVSGDQPVPTVTDNLYKQKSIPNDSLGIYYAPTVSSAGTLSGELDFGGADQSKYTGELSYVKVTSTSPASNYWGIDQSIAYGPPGTDPKSSSSSFRPILNKTAGIVDTGTTLLYLSSDAFAAYKEATGAELDETTGLLKLTSDQFKNLGSLYFTIGDNTYEWVPDAQIWPRALNSALGGDADSIYLVAADSGSESGTGLDFINGFAWLQRFYTVFDTANSQIGIATTENTSATSNFDGSGSSTSTSKEEVRSASYMHQ